MGESLCQVMIKDHQQAQDPIFRTKLTGIKNSHNCGLINFQNIVLLNLTSF